jgi:hypothetical protein
MFRRDAAVRPNPSSNPMTPEQALAFVEQHGVVLAAGKGAVPSLAEAIAGGPVKGSWWAHPQSHRIFHVFQAVAESPEVLVCRLVDGKISYVHRRVWPALARLAARFPAERLARVRQEHTAAGHHQNRETAFPQWVPAAVLEQAARLDEEQALALLGDWARTPASKPSRRKG